jgi:hypothetical protein
MHRRLLLTVVFCLFFATTLSIQCYSGIDKQCIKLQDMNDCGQGETCQCVKYRFPCTEGDTACNKEEQSKGVIKWAYTIVPESTCKSMELFSSVYYDVTCCTKSGCNRPKNVKCSSYQGRRRALRKLTDLLDF